MSITTSHFGKALLPGVNKWFNDIYDEHQVQYTALFDTSTSRRSFEEDMGVSGFGYAEDKSQGQNIKYDTMSQAFRSTYRHVVYGLGFIITREMMDDDLYDVVGRDGARQLAFSMRQTKEVVAANVYNRAFDPTVTGGDGTAMINAAHPNKAGGTYSNTLAVAADLSEAALEQSCIDIMKYTNDRGLKVNIMPKSIIITPDNFFEIERILKSDLRVGVNATGNSDINDINALKSTGKFPGGVHVNQYLTDPDAWFIRTNVMDAVRHFERRAMEFGQDNDFDSENAKFKSTERYSFGWSDPRGIFGSPGA